LEALIENWERRAGKRIERDADRDDGGGRKATGKYKTTAWQDAAPIRYEASPTAKSSRAEQTKRVENLESAREQVARENPQAEVRLWAKDEAQDGIAAGIKTMGEKRVRQVAELTRNMDGRAMGRTGNADGVFFLILQICKAKVRSNIF